jgi:hypothetical protein
MTLGDVGQYPHYGLIKEYEPPALLAYELVDPEREERMYVRVLFIEQAGETAVILTQTNLPDVYSEYVMAGWTSAFTGLAYFLESSGNLRDRSLAHEGQS